MTEKKELDQKLMDILEPQPEYVSMQDIAELQQMQKEHQLVSLQVDLLAHKIEILRLRLKCKHHLDDADVIDSQTGLISRMKK